MLVLNRETDSEIMCCRFNPEGNLIAVGLVNGVTKVCVLTTTVVLIFCDVYI